MNSKFKLVIFSVDGVLLDNKFGGIKDILVVLGKTKEVVEIDKEYQKRKHLGPWGLEQLAALYKDFPKSKIDQITFDYCSKNLMPGVQEVINRLKEERSLIGVISSNPQFIMDKIKKILNLDFAFGMEVEFKAGIATGKIIQKVDRYTKPEILKDQIKKLGLNKQNVAVVGDSLTDIAMAKEAGFFIGFNPKPEIENKADVLIWEKDLRNILKYFG